MKSFAADVGTVVLNRPKVGEIKIEGNKRIQREAILNKIDMKPGKPFRRAALGDEIKELYSMGYFDDVQIQAEETSKGEMDLRIVLKERPSIKTIEVEGNKVFTKDEILDTLTTKSFQVASTEKIREDINKIKKMYEKKGYYQPKIDHETKELSTNEAQLTFKIDEGNKSYLTEIVFDGRQKLPEDELKKNMSVKEKSWFWYVDDSGTFTREKLDENRLRIMQQYLENGFVNVQVGAPQVDIHDGRVTVKYPIREGHRFQVRNVDLEGDLIEPKEKLLGYLNVKPKTWFKRSQVAEDLKGLTRLYNNAGYAYVDIEPRQKLNDQHDFLDITYKVNKGQQVRIEKVDIHGNERTRDKIIRRQLDISEGDLYSADRFEATKGRLEATEFFEAVKLKTSPGSKPDLMNVDVEVMEKKTGSLTAGIGYSSQDGAMGNLSLTEKNLFGLAMAANAKANLSSKRNTFEGSVTYPYLFDTSVAGSLRGYKNINKEQNFVRDSDGFGAHLAFPVYGLWNFSTGFARDSSKLSGFEPVFARSVVEYYKRFGVTGQKYLNISENSLSFSLNRDTRNNTVIPTAGTKVSIGSRVSGFGGDVSFSNYFSDATYYHALIWRSIFKIRGSVSALAELGNDPIPFDRRILLGGISSVRGYKYGEIGPRDRYNNIMGGDRAIFANVEVLFPLLDELKLSGVVFFDAGNAWNVSDTPWLTTVKAGAGAGFRWISPMGPIRIEYGWKVTPEKGEEPGAFAFAMGQLF
ncbi:MAG: outer membrane protein assembly factor BamA [Desulfomonile tiedjei]|uniref:Outer membrane protein assembly factor BamA n=1 Tax=Desulfomonile tiedjei TaxID=2358 RepID=A0A9D6V527_9BACT|nr:outer membrane protein assembly factor BamA [Desulfomonile tiedjei]